MVSAVKAGLPRRRTADRGKWWRIGLGTELRREPRKRDRATRHRLARARFSTVSRNETANKITKRQTFTIIFAGAILWTILFTIGLYLEEFLSQC